MVGSVAQLRLQRNERARSSSPQNRAIHPLMAGAFTSKGEILGGGTWGVGQETTTASQFHHPGTL